MLIVMVLSINGQGASQIEPVFVKRFATERHCAATADKINNTHKLGSFGKRLAVCVPEAK